MTLDIKDRLYTSSEVAEILGVSLRSVYRYLEEGKLDADIKTATGRHRFSKKNILDFLKPGSSDVSQLSQNQNSIPSLKLNKNEEFIESKTKSGFDSENVLSDDFDFDNFFETPVVKKNESTTNSAKSNLNNPSSDLLTEEDDLEKLFDELEKEFNSFNLKDTSSNLNDSKVTKIVEDDFDFDFDFLDKNESVEDYLNLSKNDAKTNVPTNETKKNDDFDFDFDFLEEKIEPAVEVKDSSKNSVKDINSKNDDDGDFDFLNLEDLFKDETPKKDNENKNVVQKEIKEEEPENWLEKFRKASEKNVSEPTKKISDDFEDFFSSSAKSSIDEDEFSSKPSSKRKEVYYISSLSGLKEVAQTVDKVSKKFDLDYAFTLNAGLSLHKPISPFSLIHVYINENDLEIFEDYLKLTPSSEKDAQICLIMAKDRDIFEDSYELHGLFVVSNVQLRSDFIDKGLDNLAREV